MSVNKKPIYFAANWKLNKNPKETREFFEQFLKELPAFKRSQVIVFPPSTCLEATSQCLLDTEMLWGSQNCYSAAHGAFTGETSAQTVKDMAGHIVLLGHSERRTLFLENDEFIASKTSFVQSLNLKTMLCIGETLKERESNDTNKVLSKQLKAVLSQKIDPNLLIIAYEPVWAIGTGKVASVAQAQEAHKFIRSELELKWGAEIAAEIPILYGGSVKPDNAKELLAAADINGFLVGGASLQVDSFLAICMAD